MARPLALLLAPVLLAGCSAVVMQPSGDVALQQRNLIIASTVLMLLIIVPVIALTFVFAWRYRESNTEAVYDPEWHHSTQLEVVIWAAPLVIIIALGALTWLSTHTLDPYRPLTRLDAERPVPPDVKPLPVQVVALDWKWLFLYPEQGIASVNELVAPVDVPLAFRITSGSVMNSFFIPALAGQVYAMAGMETKLHAVINKEGAYDGFSANYSGAGFSRMKFKFHGVAPQAFEQWVAKVKSEGTALNRDAYLALEKPSELEPVRYFASVEQGLHHAILNMCVVPGKMCVNEMMHIDAMGGAGIHSLENRERLEYDNLRLQQGHEAPGATFPASGRPPHGPVQPQGMRPDPLSPTVNQPRTQPDPHQGHAVPGPRTDDPAPAQLNTRPGNERQQ
ncbi:MAG TPA: ubiquinol oxidase subunit II [Microvirga sp.]|nr:ubiquinol oxidase subunit II [Microvirga sp.]